MSLHFSLTEFKLSELQHCPELLQQSMSLLKKKTLYIIYT